MSNSIAEQSRDCNTLKREVEEFIGGFDLGSSIKEVVRTIGEGLITRLVDSVVPGLGTAARVLMAFAWSLRERSEVRRFIKFMIKWRELSGAGCESVKAEVAGKIAKDLGLGETEVRKTLDSLAGLKDEELEGGLINRLVDEVKQIKDRVETLEGLAGIYRKPEDLGIEFRGDVTYIVFGNVRYPFIDPGKFGKLGSVVNELEGVVKDVVESGGLLIIYGPHGIGKSTLVRYVLAKILRESGIKAVIDLNGRSSREVSGILATADGLRYTLLYDPSTPMVYEVGVVRKPKHHVHPGIINMVEEMINQATIKTGELQYRVPVIIIIPKAIYDSLSEELKRSVRALN